MPNQYAFALLVIAFNIKTAFNSIILARYMLSDHSTFKSREMTGLNFTDSHLAQDISGMC